MAATVRASGRPCCRDTATMSGEFAHESTDDRADLCLVVAPNNGPNKNPFLCGSEAAGKISLAGGLSHIPGLAGGPVKSRKDVR